MPVVDKLAEEFSDRVTFVAVAWRSTLEKTAAGAANLMPSGEILWGLDEPEEIFALYEVPYQPVTVLVTGDDVIVDGWAGAPFPEAELRARVENLIAIGA